MNAIIIDIGEIPSKDQSFINDQICSMTQKHAAELTNCYEIIATRRKRLIAELKESGNRKMLQRVRSKRHEYYLLMFYRESMKLRVVPLPYEQTSAVGSITA